MAQKAKATPTGTVTAGAPVTVDKVLATAMRMIENDGVDAFSMRKLAAELGVGTPTVYWHVGNRDELFNRLIEEITEKLAGSHPSAVRRPSASRRSRTRSYMKCGPVPNSLPSRRPRAVVRPSLRRRKRCWRTR